METQAFFENIQAQIQTRLRSRRAQLLDALHGLRTHETFETIQNITDWQFYFDNQKAGLEARLDKLKVEWRKYISKPKYNKDNIILLRIFVIQNFYKNRAKYFKKKSSIYQHKIKYL